MWTAEHRRNAPRKGMRYPSGLTDDEWRLVEPFIPPARHGGRKRHVDVREVLNSIFYVLATGCQWRPCRRTLLPRARRVITSLCWIAVARCGGRASGYRAREYKFSAHVSVHSSRKGSLCLRRN